LSIVPQDAVIAFEFPLKHWYTQLSSLMVFQR